MCKDIELYQVQIKSGAIYNFEMELQVANAEKPVLTHIPNPRNEDQKSKNPRIEILVFSED